MLISMPTGTSTIFGAFQAIVLSFVIGTVRVLSTKLLRHEKFASGIFLFVAMRSIYCSAMLRKGTGTMCGTRSLHFNGFVIDRFATPSSSLSRLLKAADKALVSYARLPILMRDPNWTL